jgi:hypothetical protein
VYITEFYKKLFGAYAPNNVSMIESEVTDIPQLSHQENALLVADFIEQEVYDAILKMEKIKHHVPMDFRLNSIRKFGGLEWDLMAMFKAFQDGSLPLFHLDFGTIILITKKDDAIHI